MYPGFVGQQANGVETGANQYDLNNLNIGGGATLSPVIFIVGMVVTLFALKLIGDSEDSGIVPRHVGISIYNLLTIGLISVLSIVSLKIAVNVTPIPGLTELANAV